MKLPMIPLAGLLLACATASGVAAAPAKPAPLPADSVYQLPLPLTDQHGRHWDWRRRRGQPQLVAMFYSSCQYMCPLIVESGKAVDRALTPAQRTKLGVLLISLDPARDTPATLAKVVQQRHVDDNRWALASPKPGDVRNAAAVLGVRYRALADGEFNHTSELILLDANGRILARTAKIGSDVDREFISKVKSAL